MIVVYFVLLVGVLIFVHELGHFLFAKLFNVKVHRFSLGFGPRALGFSWGETEYCVSWIPLGGYVKMLGEDPTDQVAHADQGRAIHQKALWQRYIIVLAGPAFNLIFPIFLYFFFFISDTTLMPAVIGGVVEGSPAESAQLQPGDKILAINGKRVRYWDDLSGQVSDRPGESLLFKIQRGEETLERYIAPVLSVQKDRLGITSRTGIIGVRPVFKVAQVGISDAASPAARAGLRTGDLITAVNGRPVKLWSELERLLANNRGESLNVSYLRPGPSVSSLFDLHVFTPSMTVIDSEPRTAGVSRSYYTGILAAEMFVTDVAPDSPAAKIGMRPGDQVVRFDGKLARDWDLTNRAAQSDPQGEHTIAWIPFGGKERTEKFKLVKVTFKDEYKAKHEDYDFGLRRRRPIHTAEGVPIENRLTYAVSKSIRRTGEHLGMMVMVVVQLVRGAIPRDSVGSVLMLAHTAQTAAEKGWDHFFWVMALISINLGILNLLPIPILDGGHIFFFTIEAIKRKPLSLRTREIASYIGLFLLISLMVFAFTNDVVRYYFDKPG
jgi:regulator of sigma E protease